MPPPMLGLEMADSKTIADVRARRRDLEADINQAEQSGEIDEVRRLKTEKDLLDTYLVETMGVFGRRRGILGDIDRSRRTVGKALLSVIHAIRRAGHHSLSRHLTKSILHPSGASVAYMPDPLITWRFDSSHCLPGSVGQRHRQSSASTFEG